MYFFKLVAIGKNFIHKLQLLIEIYLTYSTLPSLPQVNGREPA